MAHFNEQELFGKLDELEEKRKVFNRKRNISFILSIFSVVFLIALSLFFRYAGNDLGALVSLLIGIPVLVCGVYLTNKFQRLTLQTLLSRLDELDKAQAALGEDIIECHYAALHTAKI